MYPTTLVTGGAGFIGSHLVEVLLKRGNRVLVLDDLSTGNLDNLKRVRHHPNLHIVVDSIMNQECLGAMIDAADEIYHLAAVVGVQRVLDDPVGTIETNVGPTEKILRRLADQHKPLFLASTSEVYGKNSKMPLSEDDDIVFGPTSKVRWVYACSKALDEYLALDYHSRTGLPVVVARFFNTVGPRQTGRYGMVLPRFVDQALAGKNLSVHGDGEQVRCFGYMGDVIRGMMGLMACPEAKGRVFNLGNDEPVTIRMLAECVIRQVDPTLGVDFIPYKHAYGAGYEDIRCRIPDLTRVRNLIGYRPEYSLEDIVRKVVAWKQRKLKQQNRPKSRVRLREKVCA
jgi:UDP-glucose 4-epimerase